MMTRNSSMDHLENSSSTNKFDRQLSKVTLESQMAEAYQST